MKAEVKQRKQKITMTMLAKDVLKWLAKPKESPIIPMDNGHGYLIARATRGNKVDIQQHLTKPKACEVCAIGAFVAAKAFRVDGLEVQAMYREDCIDFMGGISDREEMLKIERAFEDWDGITATWESSAIEKLTLICKNIIKNKGKFVPHTIRKAQTQ